MFFSRKIKSISPLIATILLIVVSVILITVVLTWGSSFAKENLNKATSTVDFKESDLSSFVILDSFSQTETSNNIIIRNLHSFTDLNLIGYKLVTDSNYVFSNQILYFDEVITITPGEFRSLNIICFPERDFVLQLINIDLIYITLPIKINNYRSDSYCLGRDDVVAAYDMTTIVEDILMDISGNGNNGTISPDITRTETGLFFPTTKAISLTPISFDGENRTVCWSGTIYSIPGSFARIYGSYSMFNSNMSVLYFRSFSDSIVTFATNLTDSNFEKRFNFVYTKNDDTHKLYINNILVDTQIVTTTSPQSVNEISNSAENASGNIEMNDLRFYNRLFSDQEISDYHSVITNPLE